ncbi:KRAB [Mytilus coruscus]|uniref:KRAB n=1 Tax=Mytilus coruscus TaxID=42192 RepID=A0A6J8AYQ7_MYTCO|nr:KRAB [Mytilus coruscus]
MDNRLYLFKGRNGKWERQYRRKLLPCIQSKPEDEYLRFIFECKPCSVTLTDIMKCSESDLRDGTRKLLKAEKIFQDKNDKIPTSKSTYLRKKSSVMNKKFSVKKTMKKSSNRTFYKLASSYNSLKSIFMKRHCRIKTRKPVSYVNAYQKKSKLSKISESEMASNDTVLTGERVFDQLNMKHTPNLVDKRSQSNECNLGFKETAKPLMTKDVPHKTFYSLLKESSDITEMFCDLNRANFSVSRESDITLQHCEPPKEYKLSSAYKNSSFRSQKQNLSESPIDIHFLNTPFQCTECEVIFPTRNVAFRHSRHCHTEKDCKLIALLPVREKDFQNEMEHPYQTENSFARIRDFKALKKESECFCCCYCYLSKESIVSINEHIEQTHNKIVLYICLLCDKTIHGYKQGLIPHFEFEHPNQIIQYRPVSDFYNVKNANIKPHEGRDKYIQNENSQRTCNKVSFSDIDYVVSTEADSTVTEDEIVQRNNYNFTKNKQEKFLPTLKEQTQDRTIISEKNPDKNTPDEGTEKGDKRDNPIHNTLNELTGEAMSNNALGIRIVDVMSLHPKSNIDNILWHGSESPSITSIQTNEKTSNGVHKTERLEETSEKQNIFNRSQYFSRKWSSKSCTYSACNVDPLLLSHMTDLLHITQIEIKNLFDCSLCYKRSPDAKNQWNESILGFKETAKPLMTKDVPHKAFYSLLKASKKRLRLIEVHVGDIHIRNDKYANETAIYICSRCKENMPALFFVDDHLNSKHKDLFVTLNSKMNERKESEIVRNSIDDVHLCLAIDTNLYNAVQNTLQEKITKKELNKKLDCHSTKPNESEDGELLATTKQLIEKTNVGESSQSKEKCSNSNKTGFNISYIKNVDKVTGVIRSPFNSHDPSLYQTKQSHTKTDGAQPTTSKTMPVTGKPELNCRISKTQQLIAVSSSCDKHAVNDETKIQSPDDDVFIIDEMCTDNKRICNSMRKSALAPLRQQEVFVGSRNPCKEHFNHFIDEVVYQGTSVDNTIMHSGFTVQPIRPVVYPQLPAVINSHKNKNANYKSISKGDTYHIQTNQCTQKLYPGIQNSGKKQHHYRNLFPVDNRVDVKNDHRMLTKLATNNESYHQGVRMTSLNPSQNNYNKECINHRSEKSAQRTCIHTHQLGNHTQYPLSTGQYNVINERNRETADCFTSKTNENKHGFPSCIMFRDQQTCNENDRANFPLSRCTHRTISNGIHSKSNLRPVIPYANYRTYPTRTLHEQPITDGPMSMNQRFIRRYPLNNHWHNQKRREPVIYSQKFCQPRSATSSYFKNQTIFPENEHPYNLPLQNVNIEELRQSRPSTWRDCDRVQQDCLSHMEIQTTSREYSDDTSPAKYDMCKFSPVGQHRLCERTPNFL